MASPKKPFKKGKSKLTSPKKKSGLNKKAKLSASRKNAGWYKKLVGPLLFSALSVLMILMGSVLIFMAATNSLNLDWKHPFLAKEAPVVTKSGKISQKPSTLYIPKLNKVLKVSDGEFVGDRWLISQTGVSYLKTTPPPGKVGNSVLYGHNIDTILGNLYLLHEGDSIYVVSQNGNIVKYQVFETREVTPQSVEILNQTADSRLTVYTCSGFLDSARFVVVAKQTAVI